MGKFVIADRFEIADLEKDLIGRGGMGLVYRAIDNQTGETVAVKALNADALASEPSVLERFRREGEALRQLNHPNIVRFIAALESHGQHYLVMEYIDGGSLQELLASQAPLSSQRVLQIGIDLADALARAHRLGIIYRDLKPANVLLAQDGTPRLSDFGIIQLADSSPLTQTGMLVGTVNYLSPEAINSETLDQRTDIWAFGVLLFEMLTGKLPFTGKNLTARITAILTQPVPDLAQYHRDIPDALADLVYRMLQKDRQQRIPSMRLVGAELDAIMSGQPLQPATGESHFEAPLSLSPRVKSNLPTQLTAFVGRQAELTELGRQLNDPALRLATILGPGGMGKTRLSLEAGAVQLNNYQHGVYFVPLAPLDSSASILPAMAQALELSFTGEEPPRQQLLDYLRDKSMLLILDNFEHVLDGAELVAEILVTAPRVKILVTTRTRLDIPGEQLFQLEGLEFPAWETPAQALEYSAVKLFLQSARRVRPEFKLVADDLKYVARICKVVGGMPLGILLAAAWVEMLTPQEIAAEMQRSLDFLETTQYNLPERQRSMRAVFDYAWNSLNERERQAFRAVSVFRGGFTREAAQEVTQSSLRELMGLVNKSLLHRTPAGRYEIHELLRQYGAEKLAESAATAHLQDAHLDYFLKLAERIAPELYRRKMPYWLDYLEVEYANFHAALEWAQERDVEAGLRMCNALFRLWENRSDYRQEGLDWFEKFLAVNTASRTALRAWALYYAAMMSRAIDYFLPKSKQWLSESLPLAREMAEHACVARILNEIGDVEFGNENFDKARALFEESLSEARLVEDDFASGNALLGLGISTAAQLDHETALSLIEEGLTIFRNIGELIGWTGSLNAIGVIYDNHGEWNKARGYYEESLALAQNAHDRLHTSFGLHNLGNLAIYTGDFDNALSLFEQCRKLIQDTPDDRILHLTFMDIGEIARLNGKYDEAIIYFEKSLAMAPFELHRAYVYDSLADAELLQNHLADAQQYLFTTLSFLKTLKDHRLWNFSISTAAYFAIRQQKTKQAVILFGWVAGWRTLKRIILPPVYQAEFDRYLAQARERLSEGGFNAAWAEGQAMSQEQILSFAEQVLQ